MEGNNTEKTKVLNHTQMIAFVMEAIPGDFSEFQYYSIFT